MKTLATILAAITTFVIPAFAQDFNPKFGKISEQEVSMSSYPKDPEAGAMYLYDIGNIYYSSKFELVYDVYVRIKIFKKEALDLADVKVRYVTATNAPQRVAGIDANTYNLVDGKVVKTEMSKKNVFKEKISDDVSMMKFSLPEVREGSVIEYKFSISTQSLAYVPDLDIQHDYPVLHSRMNVSLPEFIFYSASTRGLLKVNTEQHDGSSFFTIGTYQYMLKELTASNDDVPALKKEPMVWNVEDYRARLDLEISGVTLHVGDIHLDERYSHRWEDVNTILAESRFGECQKAKNPFKDEVREISSKSISDEDKIREILNLVRGKIKFNDVLDKIPDSPASVVKKGIGSAADINNILSLALRDAGFESDIILLNSRSYGRLPYFPTLQRIETFLVRAKDSAGNYYFLNASDKDSDLNVMSPEMLAQNARIYGKDGPDAWVDLSALAQNSERIMVLASLDKDGTLKGNYNRILKNQDAYAFNVSYGKAGSEEKYIEEDIEKENNITVENASFDGVGTMNVTEKVLFEMEPENSGGHIYINPSIIQFMGANPFDQEKRQLPVEFDVTKSITMQVTLMVPEGYSIEESPQNTKVTACNGDVSFQYLAQVTGNSVSARLSMKTSRVLFSPEEYEELRLTFGKIAEICNAKIVIRKD